MFTEHMMHACKGRSTHMSVPNAVRWEDLDPAKIENMISVLISRLHTTVQRIDGSGGDGGRDVQIPLESGLVIYEVKSFTGRLTDSRKNQIKRSLKKAKTHNPKHWHLVMPLDLTPGELEWYNGLKTAYAFVSDFTRGRTWLDSEMASRPDIARYYVGDSNSEIVSCLREIREEEAGLSNGAPDAIARIKRVVSRLNEVDPHYKFGIQVHTDGSVKTTIFPRYPGAELDRPIIIKTKFTFPKTPEGEAAAADFRDSMDYGVPTEVSGDYVQSVEIDAPAGLGGSFSGGTFALGPPNDSELPESDDNRYSAVVTNSGGSPLATVPLTLSRRYRGGKGAHIELSDITGYLTVHARINIAERTGAFTFSFAHKEGVLPSALLQTVKFLAHMKAGNQWGLAVNGVVTQLHTLSEAFMPDIVEYGRYLKNLTEFQEHTGFPFPVPEELTETDAKNLKRALYLIQGNSLVHSWDRASMTFTREGIENWRAVTGSEPRQLLIQEDFFTEICGNRIYVGQVRKHIATARVVNLPETEGTDSTEFPVSLVPGDDRNFTTTLVPRNADEL
ncbi:hypothetical protein [Streptomyces parvulus]|uniref:hypothetical protein n=1 Tax=Streptomyces parvulus TaxID=146923 RepID=UPI0036CCC6A7